MYLCNVMSELRFESSVRLMTDVGMMPVRLTSGNIRPANWRLFLPLTVSFPTFTYTFACGKAGEKQAFERNVAGRGVWAVLKVRGADERAEGRVGMWDRRPISGRVDHFQVGSQMATNCSRHAKWKHSNVVEIKRLFATFKETTVVENVECCGDVKWLQHSRRRLWSRMSNAAVMSRECILQYRWILAISGSL